MCICPSHHMRTMVQWCPLVWSMVHLHTATALSSYMSCVYHGAGPGHYCTTGAVMSRGIVLSESHCRGPRLRRLSATIDSDWVQNYTLCQMHFCFTKQADFGLYLILSVSWRRQESKELPREGYRVIKLKLTGTQSNQLRSSPGKGILLSLFPW